MAINNEHIKSMNDMISNKNKNWLWTMSIAFVVVILITALKLKSAIIKNGLKKKPVHLSKKGWLYNWHYSNSTLVYLLMIN